MGASAATTADEALSLANASALAPVIQPPQVKPNKASAIAPPTAPQRVDFRSIDICMVMSFWLIKLQRVDGWSFALHFRWRRNRQAQGWQCQA
jgi:hypothetical protein